MGIAFKINHIMTRNIISIESNASVSEVATLMTKKEVGAVVVTKQGKPVGIITEVDILKRCCIAKVCNQVCEAKEVMSTPLITIEADASLGEAAKMMTDQKIRRLLVEEEGKIVGLVTEKDLLRATLSYFENILLTI